MSDPVWGDLDWRTLAELARRPALAELCDQQEALDISQATMIALIAEVVKTGEAPKNPSAWVTRVASNLTKNEIRRRANKRKAIDRGAKRSTDPVTEDVANRILARWMVQELLKGLSPNQRKAMWLRYGADFERATVADLMDVKVCTVQEHLARAVKSIRDANGWRVAGEDS